MNHSAINTGAASGLIKAEKIIQLISGAPDGITISELEASTSQSKSSIHRMLIRLVECDWLQARMLNDRSATWFLSSNFIRMAYQWKRHALADSSSTGDICMPLQKGKNKAELVSKAVHLFHLVMAGELKGKSLDELHLASGFPRTTSYRLLCSWEQLGWLRSIQIDGRSEKWFPSTKLIEIAHQYENQRRQQIQRVNEQYQALTGEVL